MTCQKLENLDVKLSYFGITLKNKYVSWDVAQSFYGCIKIPSWILDHNWIIRLKNRIVGIKKVHRALCTPPWYLDWPKSLVWLGLIVIFNFQKVSLWFTQLLRVPSDFCLLLAPMVSALIAMLINLTYTMKGLWLQH